MLTHEERLLADMVATRGWLPPDRLSWHAGQVGAGRTTLADSLVDSGDLQEGDVHELLQHARTLGAGLAGKLTLPHTLGDYRLLREIGRGGAGVVYEAVQLSLDRHVALKVLPAALVRRTVSGDKVLHEARAAGRLRHPGIVTVFAAGEDQAFVYFAMDLIRGPSLAQRVYDQPVSPETAARIARDVAIAIDHAHQEGFVHRDIKPENILLDTDGQPRVTDFGLVCELSDGEDLFSKHVLGTPAYMAPEQVEGGYLSARTDIYGIGSVLYAMLTGGAPYDGKFATEVLEQVRSGPPVDLAERAPSVPPALARTCARAMARDPEDRHASARELADELEAFLSTGPTQPVTRVTQQKLTRHRRYMLLALGLAAAAAIGLLWTFRPVPDVRPKLGLLRGTLTTIPTQAGRASAASIAADGDEILYAIVQGSGRLVVQTPLSATSSDFPAPPTFSKAIFPGMRGVALAPDGTRLIVDSGQNLIIDRNGAEHKITKGCWAASWSPDSSAFACADFPRHRLLVFDASTGEARTLLTDTGLGRQLAWSPHGDRIAFSITRNGRTDLVTVAATGGEIVWVTDDPALEWSPAWSPDGTTLYFGSDRGGAPDLWSLKVDTDTGLALGEATPITRGLMPAMFEISAALRRHLLLISPIASESLGTARLDPASGELTGVPTRARQYMSIARFPHRSPTSGTLVFTAGLDHDLRLGDPDAEDPTAWRLFTEGPDSEGGARWSPAGDLIAYHSDRSGSMEIWTVRADGSDQRQRTEFPEQDAMFPVWSPDGRFLAFSIHEDDSSVTGQVLRLDEDRAPIALPAFEQPFTPWSWSPDGNRLAGSAEGLVLYSLDAKQFSRLTDFGESPVWIDGQEALLFVHEDEIWHFDMRTGTPTLVHSVAPSRLLPWLALSDQGRRLDYAMSTPRDELILIDLDDPVVGGPRD